jgi:hypothetical protein
MSGRRSDCTRLKPSLVALVYEEEHPDMHRLLAHLDACKECRRERSDLELVRRSAESLEAGALDGAFMEGFEAARAPSSTFAGKGWIVSHALPAAAAVLLAVVVFLGIGESPGGARSREASIFDVPARFAARSFDGGELDRRLDWISSEISSELELLGADSW